MPIIHVRQHKVRDEVFVLSHCPILPPLFHQGAGTLQLGASQIGAVPQDIAYPFVLYLCGPLGLKHEANGKTHEQVAQEGRIQHTRIQDRRRHLYNPILSASAVISSSAAFAAF